MIAELVTFALIGLAVGAGAVALLPDLFPVPRSLTVLTGLGAALLLGGVGHAVFGGGIHLLITAPISALGAVALVSVLARPRQSAHRRPRARRPPGATAISTRPPDTRAHATLPRR